MVVDSCTASGEKSSIALNYLSSLGISYDAVKLILITHFHDDHIRGMADLIDSCPNATICVSDALVQSEAIAYVQAHAQSNAFADVGKPSAHEVKKVYEVLASGRRSVIWASAAKLIYRNDAVNIFALSPSDAAISQARLDFARAFEETSTGFQRLAKRLTPNLCAVALHICNGQDTVLLGSDLESSGSLGIGWEAVLQCSTRPRTMAKLYKVAHHGSVTGHHDQLAAALLHDPISIITTMNTHHLPTPEDIARIKTFSASVYHTTQPLVRPVKRSRDVEEIMAAAVKSRRVLPNQMGHIQVRMLQGNISLNLNEFASRAA